MFDLFGAEMPLALRFLLAFLIVLGLIGVAAWAVRRFGGGRLGGPGVRGRQPRLSIIERTSVDARRWLYLVRRDNVEHLLLIGGPTDVVVEPNIVRATPAVREVTVARPPTAMETPPRAIPLPENASSGAWPLQPEAPMPPPLPPSLRRSSRVEPMSTETPSLSAQPHAEKPRPQREALVALAEDLAANPVPPAPPPPPIPPLGRGPAGARPYAVEPRAEPRPERRPEPRPEQRVEALPEPRMPVQSTNPEAAAAAEAADKSLAEMAQRLEAALRKPKAAESRDANSPSTAGPAAPAPAQAADAEAAAVAPPPPPPTPSPPPLPRVARPAETKPARTELKAKEGKALYETLEQEMASLLGRPAGKT
jgi:flagellar protein FliO/FliZ